MLVAFVAAAAIGGQVEAAARPAAAVVDRFHTALRTGDGKAALALMSDDAVIFESGHVERSKAQYRAEHLAADMEFSRATTEVTTARTGRASANLAWIATQGRTSGSFKGKPANRATTETMLLRRTPAGWRIVHIHWSSAAGH
jgi:ketosteroid isomerase-like protein